MAETMKAVVLTGPTKAENVKLIDFPIPKVVSGWVLVKVKAFDMNHSEQVLRLHEIENDYIQKPVIPGIECVGEIVDASDSGFGVGQKVAAMMGGMGRSFHGSYAEYALLPSHHVFSVGDTIPGISDLPWARLAAVPETYYTAWGVFI
ncbi:MAG: alcohol dehydrogenase catalytic domain-containing protein [Eubacterium sp.]|nr:alcohol dehydrogenase catalytic domain-containing protein [Eubacterium sp.]